VQSQSCRADIRDIPIQISETRLQCVRLCRVLASNDFYFLGPLKKHLGGHRCQTDAKCKKLSHSGAIHKDPNSMLKAYIP
jgi:hypothetical protein